MKQIFQWVYAWAHLLWFRLVLGEKHIDYQMRLFRRECAAILKRDIPGHRQREVKIVKFD